MEHFVDRETIAYGIMLLMALALAAFVLFKWYHSHERSYRRRERHENAAYTDLMASKDKAGREKD